LGTIIEEAKERKKERKGAQKPLKKKPPKTLDFVWMGVFFF
jgi:hypothetical protein